MRLNSFNCHGKEGASQWGQRGLSSLDNALYHPNAWQYFLLSFISRVSSMRSNVPVLMLRWDMCNVGCKSCPLLFARHQIRCTSCFPRRLPQIGANLYSSQFGHTWIHQWYSWLVGGYISSSRLEWPQRISTLGPLFWTLNVLRGLQHRSILKPRASSPSLCLKTWTFNACNSGTSVGARECVWGGVTIEEGWRMIFMLHLVVMWWWFRSP